LTRHEAGRVKQRDDTSWDARVRRADGSAQGPFSRHSGVAPMLGAPV
jgi:hypothetical protein